MLLVLQILRVIRRRLILNRFRWTRFSLNDGQTGRVSRFVLIKKFRSSRLPQKKPRLLLMKVKLFVKRCLMRRLKLLLNFRGRLFVSLLLMLLMLLKTIQLVVTFGLNRRVLPLLKRGCKLRRPWFRQNSNRPSQTKKNGRIPRNFQGQLKVGRRFQPVLFMNRRDHVFILLSVLKKFVFG